MTPVEMAAELRRRALEFRMEDAAEDPGSDVPFGLINEFRQGETVVTWLPSTRATSASIFRPAGV
jgi:hypothetical protein